MNNDRMQRINEAYLRWSANNMWRDDPWAAFQWGYLTGIAIEPYPPDRVPMPQNRKQAEGMLLIAENYLKHNKDKNDASNP